MATPSQSSPLDLDQFEGFNPDLVRHAARAIEHGAFWSTGEMVATDAAMSLVLSAPALLSECKRQRAEIERLRAVLRTVSNLETYPLEGAQEDDGEDAMICMNKLIGLARAALASEGGAE